MKNFKKLIKEAHLGNPLNETAGTFGDGVSNETKAKYNKAAMDEYGKPFAELDIFQKQEIMKAIVKYSGPEFDTDYTLRRKKMSDYMNEELLKEFTLPGGDYGDSYANRLPEEQLTSTDDYEVFMEMFPQGEASRILMDPNRKKLYDQHLEWTKDSQYNNVFVHMQYHEVEHEGELYKVHQTQYYNTNYKDFRNPRFTELMISKDGKRMGTYLVDTTEYVKDLRDLESQGKLGTRVSEGTCGYGEDGVLGEEPAGPHLQKEESEGDKEIRALEKEAEKYPKTDSRYKVIQKKIGDLKFEKDYALPGSKADKKFSDMEDEMERLLNKGVGYKSSIYSNFINEDVQPLAVEELTDEALVNLLNNLDDDTGKFTRAKSELMKAAGDEVKRRGLKVHYVDNDRYEFMNEDDEVNLNVSTANTKYAEEEDKVANSGAYESLQESLRKKLQDRLK